jgi:hypothetical protein
MADIQIPVDYVYCDCAIRYVGPAKNEVDGLERLEGKDVSVVADGVVISPDDEGVFLIVTDGKITLPNGLTANNVLVGVPYESVIETLPIDPGDSSLQGQRKKLLNLHVKLEEAAGRFTTRAFGQYGYSGQVDEHRFDTMYSGMKYMLVTDSPNFTGQLRIGNFDPTPFSILGYYPKIEIYRE